MARRSSRASRAVSSESTTPNPVTSVPQSIPKTRIASQVYRRRNHFRLLTGHAAIAQSASWFPASIHEKLLVSLGHLADNKFGSFTEVSSEDNSGLTEVSIS
jgi:hypothetical protein